MTQFFSVISKTFRSMTEKNTAVKLKVKYVARLYS